MKLEVDPDLKSEVVVKLKVKLSEETEVTG